MFTHVVDSHDDFTSIPHFPRQLLYFWFVNFVRLLIDIETDMATDSKLFNERTDRAQIEQGDAFSPKFDEAGLIPAIAQDEATGDILMVAWMNAEALEETIRTRRAVYFSRSRSKLWRKGEESGNVQEVKQMLTDCDQDVIVLKVNQIGGAACHTGYRSCFFRTIDLDGIDETTQPAPLICTDEEKVFDPEQVYGRH